MMHAHGIVIDFQTESGRRGRFARMAISIDLHKPLVSKLVMNGRVQIVEYESLQTLCFSCSTYGHVQENFPKLNPNVDSAPPAAAPSTNTPHPTENEAFRPWMVVKDVNVVVQGNHQNSHQSTLEDPIVESDAQGQRTTNTVTHPVSILRSPVINNLMDPNLKPMKSKQAIPIRKPLTLSHGPTRMRMPVTPGSSHQSHPISHASINLDIAKHTTIILSENDDPHIL
ncbi:hypothetical protein GQ457_01G024410 [Hibiscus cannabinus]